MHNEYSKSTFNNIRGSLDTKLIEENMATDFNGQNAFNITDRRRFLKNISVGSATFAATNLWTMSATGQENMSFVNSGAVPRRAFGAQGFKFRTLQNFQAFRWSARSRATWVSFCEGNGGLEFTDWAETCAD